jgi:hypothetical protein
MPKSTNSIDVKYIKLNLTTNIGEETNEKPKQKEKSQENYQTLTCDMIHIPGEDLSYLKQQKNKYPCITNTVLYPYTIMQSKTKKELVDFFFNPLNFEKFLLENTNIDEIEDAKKVKGGGIDKLDKAIKLIDKYEKSQSSKGYPKNKMTILDLMYEINKSELVSDENLEQGFLHYLNDTLVTIYIKPFFEDKMLNLCQAISKVLTDQDDDNKPEKLIGENFDAINESFSEKKQKITEIIESFEKDYLDVLKCPIPSGEELTTENLAKQPQSSVFLDFISNFSNIVGTPKEENKESETEEQDDLQLDTTFCDTFDEIKKFLIQQYFGDEKEQALYKMGKLIPLIEKINDIFEKMVSIKDKYDKLYDDSDDNENDNYINIVYDHIINNRFSFPAQYKDKEDKAEPIIKNMKENRIKYKKFVQYLLKGILENKVKDLKLPDWKSYLNSPEGKLYLNSPEGKSYLMYYIFDELSNSLSYSNYIQTLTTKNPEIISNVRTLMLELKELNGLYPTMDDDDNTPIGSNYSEEDELNEFPQEKEKGKSEQMEKVSYAFTYDDDILQDNREKNLMLMLNLLFPTLFYHSNYINHSMNHIKNQIEFNDELGNKDYSYLKLNNNVHTVMKVVWLNDILNNPFYNSLMVGVHEYVNWGLKRRALIDSEIGKEAANLKQIVEDYTKAGEDSDENTPYKKDKDTLLKRMISRISSSDSRYRDDNAFAQDLFTLLDDINNFEEPEYYLVKMNNEKHVTETYYAIYKKERNKLKHPNNTNNKEYDANDINIINLSDIDLENTVFMKIKGKKKVQVTMTHTLEKFLSQDHAIASDLQTGNTEINNIRSCYVIGEVKYKEKSSDKKLKTSNTNDLVIFKIETFMQKLKDRRFQSLGSLFSKEFNDMIKKFKIIEDLRLKNDFKRKYLSCEEERCITIDIDDKEVKEDKFLETVEILKKYVQTSKTSGSISTEKTLQDKIDNFAFTNNQSNKLSGDLYNLSAGVVAKMDNKETTVSDDDFNIRINELITKKSTDPHYEAYIQMDLVGGEVTSDNLNAIKCDYNDEKLSKDFINVFIVPKSDIKYWKVTKMPYKDYTSVLKSFEDNDKKENDIKNNKTKKNEPNPTKETRKEKKKGGSRRTRKSKSSKHKQKRVRFTI